MRVKLAVQTLSSKVANEMKACQAEDTEETRQYIKICEKFWNVFDDPRPLKTIEDNRKTELDAVVTYFEDLRMWLATQNRTKAQQSEHYISWQTKLDLEVQYVQEKAIPQRQNSSQETVEYVKYGWLHINEFLVFFYQYFFRFCGD